MSLNKYTPHTAAGFLRRPAAALILGLIITFSVAAQSRPPKATVDSILGVKIGMTAEQADKALESVGVNPAGEGRGVGESEEGETKEVWTIKGTKFSQVVVRWISFFRSSMSCSDQIRR